MLLSGGARAETLRIASYNVGLDRDGPGLLLRDILRTDSVQIVALVDVISEVSPDILVLQKFDFDHGNLALLAFSALLSRAGMTYPYLFSRAPNSGVATGLDMDGDGYFGDDSDAQGFGRFRGNGGLAILSKFPLQSEAARDFSDLLWKDLPGAIAPTIEGRPFPSDAAFAVQRLSNTSHWEVPVVLPDGTPILLWTMYAAPPVFDDQHDRNGRRNHDEAAFWLRYMDGDLPETPPDDPFVLLGGFNLDPADGQGRPGALLALLGDPRIQDVRPSSQGARLASETQRSVNITHAGEASLDTVDWPDTAGRPGNMRVDYVLPSSDLLVVDSGVHWPTDGASDAASTHHLVWVDIAF